MSKESGNQPLEEEVLKAGREEISQCSECSYFVSLQIPGLPLVGVCNNEKSERAGGIFWGSKKPPEGCESSNREAIRRVYDPYVKEQLRKKRRGRVRKNLDHTPRV